VPEDLPGISTDMEGVLPVDDLLSVYEKSAGTTISDMAWFDAATRYKMAAIMGNNLRRHRTGRGRTVPGAPGHGHPGLIRSGSALAEQLD